MSARIRLALLTLHWFVLIEILNYIILLVEKLLSYYWCWTFFLWELVDRIWLVLVRKSSFGSDSMNYSLCDNVSNITYPESLAGAIIDTSNGHQQQHHGANEGSTGGNLLILNQPHGCSSFESSSNSTAHEIIATSSSCNTSGATTSMKNNAAANRVNVSNGAAAKSNHRHSNRNSCDNSIIERNTSSNRSKNHSGGNSGCSTLRVSPTSSVSSAASGGLHATSSGGCVGSQSKHATCKNSKSVLPLSERASINVPISSVVAEVAIPSECGDEETKKSPVFDSNDKNNPKENTRSTGEIGTEEKR